MGLKSPPGQSLISYTGRTLDRYNIHELLKRGRLGEIYRAVDRTTRQAVALKIFYNPARAGCECFAEVMRPVTTLEHPYILRVFGGGAADGVCYMATDQMEGTSLRDMLSASRGGIDSDLAVGILRRLAGALVYAHQKGVVHGDIKPSNITIQADQTPVLFDFKLAQALETPATTWLPVYLAPEQAAGAAPTPQSDIYALGVVFYQMVTGKVPFVANGAAGVLQQHLGEMPTPPTQMGANISQQVEAVTLWMLAKDPNTRPSSAGRLLEALGPDVEEQKFSTFVIKRPPELDAARQARLSERLASAPAPETAPKPEATPGAPPTLRERLFGWLLRDRAETK
ncbi:MAG: serine/threonine protein kinase [Anaerolineae bacterium]|nr:serine/threonine protein kinase [Anaerolineae bacterium]